MSKRTDHPQGAKKNGLSRSGSGRKGRARAAPREQGKGEQGRGEQGSDAHGVGRPGRPPGSVSLTNEIAETIINYIQAGAFAYVAAEAAGISERTFHDWMARGEDRHFARKPTPKLRRFAKAVRTAQAQARLAAEATVYNKNPEYWLSHAARSRPGREGWTDPGPFRSVPKDDEEVRDARQVLQERLDAIAARRRAARKRAGEGEGASGT